LSFTESFGGVEISSTPSYPLDRMKFSGLFTIRLPYPRENVYRYAFNTRLGVSPEAV